ncbi:MAG: winged helix-turn-helix domain-containing protein [Oscillospiraceae bacterium]
MIFCVEDDASIRDLMVYTLQSTGFDAEGLCDGAELFSMFSKKTPELILLDIMLPVEDGISILKRIRSSPSLRAIPVILATARGTEYDKVMGLDLGADDYLAKPFGMMEMVSRVRAVLRRSVPKAETQAFVIGDLRLDPAGHNVTAAGNPVSLTLKEFEMLRILMESPGQVLTRDRLLAEIWGYNFDGETRTVDVHIRTLRSKLGDCGDYIETVRGVGYRMGGRP